MNTEKARKILLKKRKTIKPNMRVDLEPERGTNRVSYYKADNSNRIHSIKEAKKFYNIITGYNSLGYPVVVRYVKS